MAPVPHNEMLDELAVDVMDAQSQMADEGNKSKHKQIIRKMIDKNQTLKKYQAVPEFETGKLDLIIVLISRITGSYLLIQIWIGSIVHSH